MARRIALEARAGFGRGLRGRGQGLLQLAELVLELGHGDAVFPAWPDLRPPLRRSAMPGSGVITPSTRLASDTVYLPGTTRAPAAPPRPPNMAIISSSPPPPPLRRQRRRRPPPRRRVRHRRRPRPRRPEPVRALRAQVPGDAMQAARRRGVDAANHFAGGIGDRDDDGRRLFLGFGAQLFGRRIGGVSPRATAARSRRCRSARLVVMRVLQVEGDLRAHRRIGRGEVRRARDRRRDSAG